MKQMSRPLHHCGDQSETQRNNEETSNQCNNIDFKGFVMTAQHL